MNIGCPYKINPHLAPEKWEMLGIANAGRTIELVCKELGIEVYELYETGRGRQINKRAVCTKAREVIAWILHNHGGKSFPEISGLLSQTHPSAKEAFGRHEKRMQNSPVAEAATKRLVREIVGAA